MNPAHVHLITTHIPVVGTFLGLCLYMLALLKRSEELKRTCLLGFFCVALAALPAYLSGPEAANLLKRLMVGISMDAGDQHAEVAILALTGSLVLGAVSLAGLLIFRKSKALPLAYLVLVFVVALAASGLMCWAANLGAQIHHQEIRENNARAETPMRIV